MCTAVIYQKEKEYGVGFNRDESRKRKPALPPEVFHLEEVDLIMPRDGDFGGTWLGANNHGMICGLLNYYEKHRTSNEFVSRGLLVRDMLARKEPELPADLSVYQAFRMFLLNRNGITLYSWDGGDLQTDMCQDSYLLLASSGSLGGKVEPARREVFSEKYYDENDINGSIKRYLGSHDPEKGAWSSCMHREDAKTVSMSCLKADDKSISFLYRAGSPCEKREDLIRVMNIIP